MRGWGRECGWRTPCREKSAGCEASVEGGGQRGAVHVAADEDELHHAVAVFLVPVAGKRGVHLHEPAAVLLGSGGVPFAGLGNLLLHAGLFKQYRHVAVVAEVQHALGAYHAFRPVAGAEVVKPLEDKRCAAVVYECRDAVFLCLALVMMMVVMMPMLVMVVMVMLLMVVVMAFLVLIVVIVMMVVVMAVGFSLFGLGGRAFQLTYPGSRRDGLVKVEVAGIEQLVEVNVAVVAVYDFGVGLNGAYDGAYLLRLLGRHFGYFVEQYYVAELHLLYHEILDVLVVDVLVGQRFAAGEIRLHAQRVHNGDDAVQARAASRGRAGSHLLHCAYGLRNRFRLADAARLDDHIVKLAGVDDFGNLAYQVGAQRAADTAVLQSHEVVRAVLSDNAPFLYQRSVDVDLAYVVDNNGEAYASAVGENTVEQSGLAAAEIAGEQEYRRE